MLSHRPGKERGKEEKRCACVCTPGGSEQTWIPNPTSVYLNWKRSSAVSDGSLLIKEDPRMFVFSLINILLCSLCLLEKLGQRLQSPSGVSALVVLNTSAVFSGGKLGKSRCLAPCNLQCRSCPRESSPEPHSPQTRRYGPEPCPTQPQNEGQRTACSPGYSSTSSNEEPVFLHLCALVPLREEYELISRIMFSPIGRYRWREQQTGVSVQESQWVLTEYLLCAKHRG